MRALSGQFNFFGLDLGTTGIRAVELKGAAAKTVAHYGHVPLDGTLGLSEAKVDQAKVSKIIAELVKTAGITNKNVAVNLPSNRVFTTVIDMDKMTNEELAKTIHYQADSFIPTPPAESKLDWAVLGASPKDPKKVEVLLSSAPNSYIESRLAILEAAGLNVIAFEPDNMALTRALVSMDNNQPQLILDIGSSSTDLVVSIGQVPHLSRSIPLGYQTMVQAAAHYLGIDQVQANQFVFKFGLGKDKLEGKVYNAIIGAVDSLVAEVEKSIKFFEGRYINQKMERIIATGGASSLPEFPLHLANRFKLNVEIGDAWRNVSYPPAQQNELAASSNHFGVAVGLAERQP